MSGAGVDLEVFDNELNLWLHSLDTIKTDTNGNAEFQPLEIDEKYFKVGKTYNVKAFVSAKG